MIEYDFLNNTSEVNKEKKFLDTKKWKMLIVDDEIDIHTITNLALKGFTYQNKEIEFLNAYSAKEAKQILLKHNDIAIVLLDIVMETKLAGLDLVEWIRSDLKNNIIRIILRTGHPGDAPEKEVIMKYDINDYKEKSELTSTKLFSLVYNSIRSFQNINTLYINQHGMKKIIEAAENIFNEKSLALFLDGVFEQIFSLYKLKCGSLCNVSDTIALVYEDEKLSIISKNGIYKNNKELNVENEFGITIEELLSSKENIINLKDEKLAIVLKSVYSESAILFMHNIHDKTDNMINYDLLQVFINNVNSAFENLTLYKEMENTQKEIAYRLGEAVETRSKESGFHVKRVSLISEILARKYGLEESFVNNIKLASPLHDIGKISISDGILHKRGKLNEEERLIMKTHSQVGYEMLSGSSLTIMKIAASLALYHHEHWDGNGYPMGIKKNEIPIEARITAVADVFDALLGERCYKEAWPIDKVVKFFEADKGKHFEPKLVTILLENIPDILKVYGKYKD